MNKTNCLAFLIVIVGTGALLAGTANSQSGQFKNYMAVQGVTPGVSQSGHSNISGTMRASQFVGGGSGLTSVNADLLNGLTSSSFLTAIPNPLNLTGTTALSSIVRGANSSGTAGSSGVSGEATSATGTVYGVQGISNSTTGRAIYGEANATTGASSAGYFNNDSVGGYGVRASSDGIYGVYGTSTLLTGVGVFGAATNTGSGAGNYGLYGESSGTIGAGVFGESLATSGANFGGRFRNNSTAGVGVSAATTATTGNTYAGRFENNSTSGRAVFAYSLATSGTTYGVYGSSDSDTGYGVFGRSTTSTGVNFGVRGESASTSGRGISGYASNTTGTNYGGHFEAEGSSGRAVFGLASNTAGTNYGGHFTAAGSFGRGVYGAASGTADKNYGGYFQSFSTDGEGVRGVANAAGTATGGVFVGSGVSGYGAIAEGSAVGLLGISSEGTGYGVLGTSDSFNALLTHYGVYGSIHSGSNGWAVFASGSLGASGTKSFRIDHPLDPENKYLIHYSTESPTPQNFYVGNVTTNSQGRAWVELPNYFASVNTNFKYQLTVIGDDESQNFVQVKVAKKIQGNRFLIMSSAPNVEVSWRVDADRNDAWVQANPARDEVEKASNEKGLYQHPELYGQSPERGMNYRIQQRAKETVSRDQRK